MDTIVLLFGEGWGFEISTTDLPAASSESEMGYSNARNATTF